MTPKKIITAVRLSPEIADIAAVRYSDYQILTAINTVLSMIYTELAADDNTLVIKTKDITLTDKEGKLPSDYISIYEVFKADGTSIAAIGKSSAVDKNTYKIIGNRIFSENETLTIEYKPYFTELTLDEINDDLDLPNYYEALIRAYTVVTLTGTSSEGNNATIQRLLTDIASITAKRAYNRIEASTDNGWHF